jgi:trans-aconitate 2-methyltransferase
MADWNPSHYLSFASERSLPIIDLINRLPISRPRVVFDLGCGPGNSTELLRKAYPDARITGLDKSPAMIAKAKEALPNANFEVCDAAAWRQDKSADLIFSNATMQWLPDHLQILQRLARAMKSGAVLAVQMPDNLAEPTHTSMVEVAALPVWRDKLKLAQTQRAHVGQAVDYYNALKPEVKTVSVWRTTYHHAVDGVAGIFDFFASTGLKPFLDRLQEQEQGLFRAEYMKLLSHRYHLSPDGKILFGLPRLFIVVQK